MPHLISPHPTSPHQCLLLPPTTAAQGELGRGRHFLEGGQQGSPGRGNFARMTNTGAPGGSTVRI